jgi:hypothetical protein
VKDCRERTTLERDMVETKAPSGEHPYKRTHALGPVRASYLPF